MDTARIIAKDLGFDANDPDTWPHCVIDKLLHILANEGQQSYREELVRLMKPAPPLDARTKDLDARLDDAFELINYLSRRVDRLLHVVDKLHRGEKVEIGETE